MTAVEGQPAAVGDNDEQPAGPPAPCRPLRRNRDFNVLWGGQALSDLGTQMSAIAYPLLVLAVTGSAAQAGIVGSATIAGQVLWLLPAGVAADRWPRKRILVITSLVQMVVGTSVVPAITTGHVYLAHLAAVGFIQGSALAFFAGAVRGAVRRIVPPKQLPDAYAQIQARDRAAVMIGPPAGAALYSVARFLPFAADAVSFGAVSLAAGLLRGPTDPEADSTPDEVVDLRLWQRVMLGMRYVFASPYLRMVTIWASVVNGVIVGVRLTAIVLAKHLGASPTQIGLLFSISAAIGLAGAILSRRMIAVLGERRLVQVVSLAFPVCSVIMAATPWIWPIGIAAGLTGFFLMPINVVLFSRAALLTPDYLQAQMTNAMTLCWTSLSAATPALFGVIIDGVGPRSMIYIAAALYLAIAIWMLSRSSLKLLQSNPRLDAPG
jgi:MFS family permease